MAAERNLDTEAAIIVNDLDSMAHRIEALQAHAGYTLALNAVKAAKESIIAARAELHQRGMRERIARGIRERLDKMDWVESSSYRR